MTVTMKIILSVLITALVVGGGTYYGLSSTTETERAARQEQIDALSQKSGTPTPTPSAAATATATSAYGTLKGNHGFTLQYPKEWSFVLTADGEGLPRETYTAAKASKSQTGVLDSTLTNVTTLLYPKSAGETSLTEFFKTQVENANNTKDLTVGTKKYAAKRYDNGGGIGGFTVTYLTSAQLASGNTIFVLVNYETDNASNTPTDVQHMLDTLTLE